VFDFFLPQTHADGADRIFALADPRDKTSPSSGQAGQGKTARPAGNNIYLQLEYALGQTLIITKT
jgi:hypothetical protein